MNTPAPRSTADTSPESSPTSSSTPASTDTAPTTSGPSPAPKGGRRTLWMAAALIVASSLLSVGITALLLNIFEKQQEGKAPFFRVVELTDEIDDPAEWGKNFPLQYDDYKRTVDMQRTRYGGSEAVPHTPTDRDPRLTVTESKVGEGTWLKTIWAGYAFAKDFREERGHAYMLVDQQYTERQVVAKQPGTCLHCHASVYKAYKEAGDGDLIKGFEVMNQMPYAEAAKRVDHPVACIDCHDPASMALRVTRPGFIEGMRTLKASQGIDNYDVNQSATRQEMRSFVCGQCHVEYYFKGPEKRLTYPWHKGLQADQILAYYEETGFKDWTHALTQAPVLKAQHPEFELWNQGIHARSGVSCSDCHMPYKRVGSQKISDHHVRSPLLNINRACQTCHHAGEQEILERAEQIQARTAQMRDTAAGAVVALIEDIAKTQASPAVSPAQLQTARAMQRKSQFLLDFIEAENSLGFHAPQESARILTLSIDYARQGQVALHDPSFQPTVNTVDLPAFKP